MKERQRVAQGGTGVRAAAGGTDYINDERSGIVDALSTMVVDKTHLKMYVWYDKRVRILGEDGGHRPHDRR